MTDIQCPLNAAAREYDDLPAIISGDKVISYGEYEQMVVSVDARLTERGLTRGQRIAIVSNSRWEYLILLHAILRLGGVACPVSPRFPEKTILSVLKKIDCAAVVDPLNRLSPGTSGEIRRVSLDTIFKNGMSHADKTWHDVTVDLERHATIILTSGSSAVPKAAVHSFGNHYYSALGSNRNVDVQPGDRWLLSLPLYHVGGLGIIFRMLLGRGTVVIPEVKENIGESMDKYGITHLSLVSTQLYRLLKEGLDLQTIRRLKAVLVGGGTVPSSLITKGDEAGLPICTTYGLTEMASQVTTTAPNDHRERLSSSGKVLDYRSVKIDAGEILVKGKTLFTGYVEAGKMFLPVDDEGWFRTGDLGRLDVDGYLTFLGRRDNMFISGGENICPEEIESILCLLPHISQALVVPVEDREFGFRPLAFIKTQQGKPVDQRKVLSHLERYLPGFKTPVAFYEWPEKADKDGLKPNRRYLTKLAQELKSRGVS